MCMRLVKIPKLLTGKALKVLYYVDHPRTVSEIADRVTTTARVNRILKRFRDRGLVSAFSAAVSAARLDSSVLLSLSRANGGVR